VVPTTNQVSELLRGLRLHEFGAPEVEENFIRTYKPVPNRLRPDDIMVGHTGFLVFARNIPPDAFPERRSRRLRRLADQVEFSTVGPGSNPAEER
jgi:tRNA (adenine57-N1/adenine58-N1)-methyltransferase